MEFQEENIEVPSYFYQALWITVIVVLLTLHYFSWAFNGKKGPYCFPVLGCGPQFTLNKRRLHDYIAELLAPCNLLTLDVYGETRVYIANPKIVEHMLKTNAANYIKGEDRTKKDAPLLGQGILNAERTSWQVQRAILAKHAVCSNFQKHALKITQDKASQLCQILSLRMEKGYTTNLQSLFAQLALECACVIMLREDLGLLNSSINRILTNAKEASIPWEASWAAALGPEMLHMLSSSSHMGTLQRALTWVAGGLLQKSTRSVQRMRKYAKKVALGEKDRGTGDLDKEKSSTMKVGREKHAQQGLGGGEGKEGTALFSLLAADDSWLNFQKEKEQLEDMVVNIIVAAAQPMASLLLSVFFLLSQDQETQRLVAEEVEHAFAGAAEARGGGDNDQGEGRDIEAEALPSQQGGGGGGKGGVAASPAKNEGRSEGEGSQDRQTPPPFLAFASALRPGNVGPVQMPYLHAVIFEALRLYPPVPELQRQVAEAEVLPDGTEVFVNDCVIIHAYTMGRKTDIWGPDAASFRPTRWLQNGKFQQQSPFKLPAFQAGPRTCLGKDLAVMQVKIIASTVLYFFNISTTTEQKPACAEKSSLLFEHGFNVKVDKRASSSSVFDGAST